MISTNSSFSTADHFSRRGEIDEITSLSQVPQRRDRIVLDVGGATVQTISFDQGSYSGGTINSREHFLISGAARY
jgi:hypothetical protein